MNPRILCAVFLSIVGYGEANASEKSNSCIQVKETGWWFVPATPGHIVIGAQYAIPSDAQMSFWQQPNRDLTLDWTSESKFRRLSWHFRIADKGYRTMRVAFSKSLGGLEVDAKAYTDTGAKLTLLDEKRIFSNTVEVSWPDVRVVAVVITLHRHLHRTPAIDSFQVGYFGRLSSVPVFDESFKKSNVVYFYHDGLGEPELQRSDHSREEIPIEAILGAVAKPAVVTVKSEAVH